MTLSPRERRLLAVLGVLAGLGALRGLWMLATPKPMRPRVATGATAPRAAGRRGTHAATIDRVIELHVDQLDPTPHELKVGRDLFRFAPPPPPPPPPPPSAEDLEVRRRQAAEQARLAAIPHPPPFDLTYLGSFGPAAKRIAVFSDAGGNVIDVHEGTTIGGKFIVDHIGYESVDIKFVGFPDLPAQRLGIGG